MAKRRSEVRHGSRQNERARERDVERHHPIESIDQRRQHRAEHDRNRRNNPRPPQLLPLGVLIAVDDLDQVVGDQTGDGRADARPGGHAADDQRGHRGGILYRFRAVIFIACRIVQEGDT